MNAGLTVPPSSFAPPMLRSEAQVERLTAAGSMVRRVRALEDIAQVNQRHRWVMFGEMDYRSDLIAGVSIGAVTAVLLARPRGGDPLAALERCRAFLSFLPLPFEVD